MPDIRRVFQYHGAEHKTISTYEAGEALTVANARAKTTMHPRCGTTFLVMVALVSILVFTGIGALLPRIHTGSALLDNLTFFVEKPESPPSTPGPERAQQATPAPEQVPAPNANGASASIWWRTASTC